MAAEHIRHWRVGDVDIAKIQAQIAAIQADSADYVGRP